MKPAHVLGLAGAALVFFGTLMPFVKVAFLSISYSDGDDSVIVMIAAALGAVFLFFRKAAVVSVIAAVVAAVVVAVDLVDALSGDGYITPSIGTGVYVMFIGCAILAVGGVMAMIAKPEEVESAA